MNAANVDRFLAESVELLDHIDVEDAEELAEYPINYEDAMVWAAEPAPAETEPEVRPDWRRALAEAPVMVLINEAGEFQEFDIDTLSEEARDRVESYLHARYGANRAGSLGRFQGSGQMADEVAQIESDLATARHYYVQAEYYTFAQPAERDRMRAWTQAYLWGRRLAERFRYKRELGRSHVSWSRCLNDMAYEREPRLPRSPAEIAADALEARRTRDTGPEHNRFRRPFKRHGKGATK